MGNLMFFISFRLTSIHYTVELYRNTNGFSSYGKREIESYPIFVLSKFYVSKRLSWLFLNFQRRKSIIKQKKGNADFQFILHIQII